MATGFHVLILSANDVRAALPMRQAIDTMRAAFTQLAHGQAELPQRTVVRSPEHDAVTLLMPGRYRDPLGLGAKIVSVFPRNAARARPTVNAAVLLCDAATGEPAALLEGGALTAIRTGAASGLATDLLARTDAARVAVIGSGVQARTQLEAVCAVRCITSVAAYSPTAAHVERFAEDVVHVVGVPSAIDVASSPRLAVRDADVICLATSSADPVLAAADVEAGVHVNAIGSFAPHMREFEPALLQHARLVVDQRAAALAEAGEVIEAVRAGLIDERDLQELGAVAVGDAPARHDSQEVTLFKSVGLAIQDLAAAAAAVRAALVAGLGTEVDL